MNQLRAGKNVAPGTPGGHAILKYTTQRNFKGMKGGRGGWVPLIAWAYFCAVVCYFWSLYLALYSLIVIVLQLGAIVVIGSLRNRISTPQVLGGVTMRDDGCSMMYQRRAICHGFSCYCVVLYLYHLAGVLTVLALYKWVLLLPT